MLKGMYSLLGAAFSLLFASFPATSNYQLNSYGFGSGGTANSQTATYRLEGMTGELTGANMDGGSADAKPGFIESQQANVPRIASLSNNSGEYYNKLRVVLDEQGNPADSRYLIAVSADGFAADTRYLRPDGTLTQSLTASLYQTYAQWGAAGGVLIIGLEPSTTYSVKAKATQGDFTESAYGPIATEATDAPSLTFGLATSQQATPPFSVSLGTLTPGTVNTTAQSVNTSVTTNGASGASVYVSGTNGGLRSTATGLTIPAVSNDLAGINRGFGAQSTAATQNAGGPFTAVTPYDGGGDTVGIINTLSRSLFSTTTPVTNGNGTVVLKAKADTTDIAANDYQDILTFTAAGNF